MIKLQTDNEILELQDSSLLTKLINNLALELNGLKILYKTSCKFIPVETIVTVKDNQVSYADVSYSEVNLPVLLVISENYNARSDLVTIQ